MNAALDRILLDHTDGILLLVEPPSLRIVEASNPTLRLLGYRRDEFVGHPITEFECSPADTHFWEEVLRDGSVDVHGIETLYRCSGGETLPASKTVRHVAHGDGSWLAVRAVPLPPQREQKELAQAMSRLRATLEAVAEGILLIDCAGHIVNMNRRFARIWRVPEGLLLEHEDSRIFAYMSSLMADVETYQARLADIWSKTGEESFDIMHLADQRVFERRSTPVRSAGQLVGRVFSFSDITRRRRSEAARYRLAARLRESQKMEALGTLAGGVAHDFNNIVAVIMGNVELARQDVGPAHAANESLEEIHRASQRARALVRRILAFGRPQAAERSVISLEPVVAEATRSLRSMLPAEVSLAVECAPDVPTVLADPDQIQQALMNLCGNAWQALRDVPRKGLIRIGLREHVADGARRGADRRAADRAGAALRPGRYACVSVADNGCGMNATTRARIFEPFFTTKPAGEGTGLGLSVVHGIVKDHEARIEVDSRVGEGSTFRIYFSAAEAPDAPSRRLPSTPGASSTPVTGEGASPSDKRQTAPSGVKRAAVCAECAKPVASTVRGGRILYVDDDESIIYLMTRLLQRKGYRVSGFTDPRTALAAMRADSSQFDMAITDFNMPGISGLEVVQALREIRADLPVALASGYITEDLRARVLAAGASELIYKPNTADELCAAVTELAASLSTAPSH